MLHLPSEYKQQLDVAAIFEVVLRRLDEKKGGAPRFCAFSAPII